jgi:hypothetical protein
MASRIEQEHADLRKVIKEIETDIRKEPSKEDFTAWKLDFMRRFRDFQNELVKHFDLEEEGGFMEDLVARAPHHARQVDALELEHEDIATRLGAIADDLKRMNEHTMSELPGVRKRVQEVLEVLHSHEEAERDLIQKAYFQDIGVGD